MHRERTETKIKARRLPFMDAVPKGDMTTLLFLDTPVASNVCQDFHFRTH